MFATSTSWDYKSASLQEGEDSVQDTQDSEE